MNEIPPLVGHQFQSLTRREFDWAIHFDKDTSLVIECLWRLLESGRIRLTSEDDGHQFGLPAPLDAAAEVNSRLAGMIVVGVELRRESLDLEFHFNTGHVLQIIPNSSGYEAWHLAIGAQEFIAIGGGKLATLGTTKDAGNGMS